MEHKIGEIVTLPDGRKAEVMEYEEKDACCHCSAYHNNCCLHFECASDDRTDHKGIIYKEVK